MRSRLEAVLVLVVEMQVQSRLEAVLVLVVDMRDKTVLKISH